MLTGLLAIVLMVTQIIAPFKPFEWQIAPWRDTSPIVLLTGSAGGGKSQLAAEKVHGFLKRYTNAFAVMARKTRESMINSTVLFMEREVIGSDPAVKHFPSKHRFEYRNGSILAYGGMADEEQREQIRSIGSRGGVDLIWMEEANRFTENDFNELLARLRGKAAPWQQLILTTNPDYPAHWINTRLIIGGEAKVYYSSAHDNPALPAQYFATLDKLTGVLRLRLRDGKWVQAEGAVYDTWDPKVHVIDPFPIPADWRRFRAVDFGYTNPFVCHWYAQDPDGRLYLYRELYYSHRLVEDHAKQIVALSQGERIEFTVADHDAEDRATLLRYGIDTWPAHKDISPGIQTVQTRLRVQEDGKPRLFILSGALVEKDPQLESEKRPTCLEEEMPAYVWPRSSSGQVVKEVPVKDNDHACDTLRYAVAAVDITGGYSAKFESIEW